MDIIDIAIAKSKSTAVDPSDISSAVSDYLDEHGVQVETDVTLSITGMPADANAVGNVKSSIDAYLNSWEEIYGFWKAGYFYDDMNDYEFTQIADTEKSWGVQTVMYITFSTPPDKLISVTSGEIYKIQGLPIYMDSRSYFIPSVVLFDSNKHPVEGIWLRKVESDPARGTMVFTIPEDVAYMALIGINYVYKKVHRDTDFKAQILNAINSHYRLLKSKKEFSFDKPLNKGYICIGTDDLRRGETKYLHDMFSEYNIPYYMAAIPNVAKEGVIGAPYHTNFDYMQMCIEAGGEIITHNGSAITANNEDDFDFLYSYFWKPKEELAFYGFESNGIYKAGDTNAIATDIPKYEAWASYYYDFGDLFSDSEQYPYHMGRACIEWITKSKIDDYVSQIINEHKPINFFTHSQECAENFAYLMEKLSAYTRGTDYEFITPSQLYELRMNTYEAPAITIDTTLDSTSTNPVTNAAISAVIGDIESALQALR